MNLYWPVRRQGRPSRCRGGSIASSRLQKEQAPVLFGDVDRDHGRAPRLEGGDVMPIIKGTVLVGMGERTTPQQWKNSPPVCSPNKSPNR